MIRAQVSGALDFSKSSRFSGAWVFREHWILEELAATARTQLYSLRMNMHIGAMAGIPGTDSYDHHYEEAYKSTLTLSSVLLPWLNWAEKESSVESQVEEWEQSYGIKKNSPEWDAMLKRFALWQKSEERKREQEDDGR